MDNKLRLFPRAIFHKPWFRAAGPEFRELYVYCWQNCNEGGFYEVDREQLKLDLGWHGSVVEWAKVLNSARELIANKEHEHVRLLHDGAVVWIVHYVLTQHRGGLSPELADEFTGKTEATNHAHRPVYAALRKFGVLEDVLLQYERYGIGLPCKRRAQRKVEATKSARQVLAHLKTVTRRNFHECDGTLRPITLRLGDGFTIEDCIKVIDHQQAVWGNDPRWAHYVRPSTLFRPSKFAEYLAEASAAHLTKTETTNKFEKGF